MLRGAFNLFFESKLGSAIFKRIWYSVPYRNYLVQITFLSFLMIKKWSIKITISSVSGVVHMRWLMRR